MENKIPKIRDRDGIPTLYVENQPFFARAGEVHNSSAHSPKYMETHVWDKIEALHLNTLLVPVYWEQTEPEEGVFCYELIDSLLGQARKRKIKLVLLWFGLWKNGESMYVPGWMKQDSRTYFRAEHASGERQNTVSPFCAAAVKKDAAAFAGVMAHIREQEKGDCTVIAVQVENEVGLLGSERDYCAAAQEKFAARIPEEMADAYQVEGTWTEAFGEDAGEYFMAYYFASALEEIASAGRREYPLPCYTNAWLRQHPWYAGSYPSGGPVKEVHRIWKEKAPSLFALAPDIYVPYTADVMEEYAYPGNPLFIPEVRKDAASASYALYAFMKCHALCYSPFGIEDLGLSPEEVKKPSAEVMAALNINPAVFEMEGGREYLGATYRLLQNIEPLYLKYRGTEHMQSYVKKSQTDAGIYFRFKEYRIVIDYMPEETAKPVSAGVIFELDENRFLIAGMRSRLTFLAKSGTNRKAALLSLQEGTVENGAWILDRNLNGDEQMSICLEDAPSCICVELYQY